MNQLERYRILARRVSIIDGEDRQLPITKVGGVPWWPMDVSRPACSRNHSMAFIAQFLLGDLPEPGPAVNSLLSFHYCMSCAYEGRMSFGWTDANNREYDVRLFENPERFTVDRVGSLTESVVGPGSVQLLDTLDFPTFDDLPADLHELAEYGDFEDETGEENTCYENVTGTKMGGWPSWVQDAKWPETEDGRMVFVAQVDSEIGERTAWGGGGYAYLFVSAHGGKPGRAELSILTT